MRFRKALEGGLAVALGLALAGAAHAQDSAWIDPLEDTLGDVTSGLVSVGTVVVGIGVAALGLWVGATGRMDWTRAAMMLIGGVLVIFGGQMVSGLLS